MLPNTIDKLLGKVEKVTESGCWIWMGYTNPQGYGRTPWSGRILAAHRIIYEHFKGPIPEGMLACHSCDVPSCCNPDHIFIGTEYDNAIDAFRKGRMYPRKAIRKRVAIQTSRGHCKRGHPYSGYNLITPGGRRKCRICSNWVASSVATRRKMLKEIGWDSEADGVTSSRMVIPSRTEALCLAIARAYGWKEE